MPVAARLRSALGSAVVGMEVRAGVHTGSFLVSGADLHGLGLHIAARVMASAIDGGVRVTAETVASLGARRIQHPPDRTDDPAGYPGGVGPLRTRRRRDSLAVAGSQMHCQACNFTHCVPAPSRYASPSAPFVAESRPRCADPSAGASVSRFDDSSGRSEERVEHGPIRADKLPVSRSRCERGNRRPSAQPTTATTRAPPASRNCPQGYHFRTQSWNGVDP